MRNTKLYEEWRNANQQVVGPIDEIKWGLPTKELHDLAMSESVIKDWFLQRPDIISDIVNSVPANSSETTRKELNTLLDLMKAATRKDIQFAKIAEEDRQGLWLDFIKEKKLAVKDSDIAKLFTEIGALYHYLKEIINRPRPWQLAYYYGLDLYPLIHTDAGSSAYPGGHAIEAYLIGGLLANKYPFFATEILNLCDRIVKSREYTGLHFPSDSEISKRIVDIIINNKIVEI